MSATTVSSIFHNMEYGPASEDLSIAKAWFSKHNYQFGDFFANKHHVDSKGSLVNSLKWEELSEICHCHTHQADTMAGFIEETYGNNWRSLSCHARALHLYSIARHIQKNSKLLATVGVICGITARRMKNVIVPLLVRHFYYYAGWAEVLKTELPDLNPLGTICIKCQSESAIELSLLKVGPALATGNTVYIDNLSPKAHIFAILFAELCAEAGLPPNVIRVLHLTVEIKISKTIFIGPGELSTIQKIQRLKHNDTKENIGNRTCIVYESADIDSAVEGIVDSTWNNESQQTGKGSTVLVQQPIYSEVISKLKRRMTNLRLGSCKDNVADLSVDNLIAGNECSSNFSECLEAVKKIGAEVYQCNERNSAVRTPTLITGWETSSGLNFEKIPFPILIAIPFRTSKEAIAICNIEQQRTFSEFEASIFTEKLPLAMEAAKSIKASTIWINCTKMADAAATISTSTQLGLGSIGGKEGLYEFMQAKWQPVFDGLEDVPELISFGVAYSHEIPLSVNSCQSKKNLAGVPEIDTTFKLYYGGGQKRPDAGSYRIIKSVRGDNLAEVPEANRKDVRNAVEAAVKAQSAWEKRSGFNRSQILFYLAENLEQRRDEMVAHLLEISAMTESEAQMEVAVSIERLFYWAAFADKHGGGVPEVPMAGVAVRLHEALGLIGIVCPEESPLLAFVSLLAPAVTRGNAVVIVPSVKCPTIALKFYQLLETSDVPAGIVNILTGNKDHLTKHITEHHDVQSIWYFGSINGATFVSRTCLMDETSKRMWINDDKQKRDWFNCKQGQGYEFLHHSTRSKMIWMPMGETFAN